MLVRLYGGPAAGKVMDVLSVQRELRVPIDNSRFTSLDLQDPDIRPTIDFVRYTHDGVARPHLRRAYGYDCVAKYVDSSEKKE